MLRWKRETSAPVAKVFAPLCGWPATLASITFSALGSVPAGTLTWPEAIASSSCEELSAIERSDSDSEPTVCATAICSAILGVASIGHVAEKTS